MIFQWRTRMTIQEVLSSVYKYTTDFDFWFLFTLAFISLIIGAAIAIFQFLELLVELTDNIPIFKSQNDVKEYKSLIFQKVRMILLGVFIFYIGIILFMHSEGDGKIQIVQNVNNLTYEEVQGLLSEYDVEIRNCDIIITMDLSDLDSFPGNDPRDYKRWD